MRALGYLGAALLALSTVVPVIRHGWGGREPHRGSHSLYQLANPGEPCCRVTFTSWGPRWSGHISELGPTALPVGGKEFHALLFFAAASLVTIFCRYAQFLWVFLLVLAAELGLAAYSLSAHIEGWRTVQVVAWGWCTAAVGILLICATSVNSMLGPCVRRREIDVRAFD